MTEDQARDTYGDDMNISRAEMAYNDRAMTERHTNGGIKVIHRKNKILGVTIAGHHAGEMIYPWILAIQNGLKFSDFTSFIAPYPTYGEISKKVASDHIGDKFFNSKLVRLAVKFLRLFG
jgi:pyruvate/2-oxoglutarate dehydrogenase complex dihydrolipoamide dehydrogenase (E3) component